MQYTTDGFIRTLQEAGGKNSGKGRSAKKDSVKLLMTSDIAAFLNVSEHTIYRWCRTGKIPHFNLNNTYRFNVQEIGDWLDSKHRQEQPGKRKVNGSANLAATAAQAEKATA